MKISKILIANRGEIACRIIRTAKKLGYETVAVYSAADAEAPHVQLANQAVRLGNSTIDDSYMNSSRLLTAAHQSGADAVHPGYGFLSENAAFAQQIIEAGLTWIGPSPESIAAMANKAAAKAVAAATAVPTLQGYHGEDQSDNAFANAANQIGYPVMLKAAAGGGGRGMRLVENEADLAQALTTARSEAFKAFGSDELLLEKAVFNPRHIEVQIFGDQQGNIIHFGERDCSIQRRHQKVIEEAPSPVVTPQLRQQLGEAAVLVGQAVNYHGAGTVEFLLDEAGSFYFLEMNTRLQVEHPVTEMICGIDLVAWQLLVAEGQPLPIRQDEVYFKGHAIEARLYAEDPNHKFLPRTGTIHYWQPPHGEGVRVDHGLLAGMAIPPYYDAMLGKIICWGETREIARRRLVRALEQTAVLGVTTNRQFLMETAVHPIFEAGAATTQFVEQTWLPNNQERSVPKVDALAGLLFYLRHQDKFPPHFHNWHSWPATFSFEERLVVVTAVGQTVYQIKTADHQFSFQTISHSPNHLIFSENDITNSATYAFDQENTLWLQFDAATYTFSDHLLSPPQNAERSGSGNIVAPMPGSIMRIAAAKGEKVTKGQTLLVLEAMKMEHEILAPFDGIVEQILVAPGQQMQPRELMVVLKLNS